MKKEEFPDLVWILADKKPPSFLTVLVKNGKKKYKAWWDAPNDSWFLETNNIWDAPELHAVTFWAEIPDLTFKMQIMEKKLS